MDSILVVKKENHYIIYQGEKSSEILGYDEMLGLFAALTMPKERPCLQWMKTDSQHKHQKEYFEDIKEANSNPETQEVDFEIKDKSDET